MTEIDREPGGSTMIRVSTEVREMIETEKIIPREPLNDCIKRGILENRKYKAMLNSLETRERLRIDFEGNTCNPNAPEPTTLMEGSKEIWNKLHPQDLATSDDIIHHINGNHNDDRPENLKKVTHQEHHEIHKTMRIDYNPTKGDINKPKLS